MSAELVTDLAGLAPPGAIASVAHTAQTIAETAMQAPAPSRQGGLGPDGS